MFKKRLVAYIIDLLILNLILSFVGLLFPVSDSLNNLNNSLVQINDSFINENLDVVTYINRYSSISYSIDREVFLSNLVGVVISICYFVVIPLYNNGSTFGKKMMNLRIVDNGISDVSANRLLVRYLLMDGIGVSILSLCFLFVLNDFNYMLVISILSILQFLVVLSSVFMVLYRRDFRSLPDLIAGTKVIEVEK